MYWFEGLLGTTHPCTGLKGLGGGQNINIELQQKNIGSITHTKKIENNSKLEAHLCLYSLSGNTLSVYYLLCILV
jgi:hypothetical protein